jgi:predicted ferric reductase
VNTKKFLIYTLFVLHLVVTLFFWWGGSHMLIGSGVDGTLLAFGRLFGILAVTFVLLQFMIMGRAPWIEKVFGLDKLSQFHHWNGYAVLMSILIHPALVILSYAMTAHVSVLTQDLDFAFHYDDMLKAQISVVLFVFVVFSSVYIVRKHMKYEWWYAVHLLTYIAVLFAFGHQLKYGGDFAVNKAFVSYWYALYFFVFVHTLIFRFGRILFNYLRFQFRVDHIEKELGDAVSVYITGNNLERFTIKPGQFLIFRFINKRFWWQHHPFSSSFIPKNNILRLTAKNAGDFTSEIGTIKKGTPVLIDGPYGTFTISPGEKKSYLFIAGGIGITPIRSLIEQTAPQNDIVLLYTNKFSTEFSLKDELDELAAMYHFPITYIVTQGETYQGEKGRIDADKIKRLVPDYKKREVYICGPVPMMEGVKTNLVILGVTTQHIHYEKFSLH